LRVDRRMTEDFKGTDATTMRALTLERVSRTVQLVRQNGGDLSVKAPAAVFPSA